MTAPAATTAAPTTGAAAPADDNGTFLDWIAGLTPLDPQGAALIEGARALQAEIATGAEANDISQGEL